MLEVTEKYYMATDGKKFKDAKECKEYEDALLKLKILQERLHSLNKEIAFTEYILYYKGQYINLAKSAGGCGHDGFYSKCPHCEELVGGYEGRNTSLKVDKDIYKCEMCGTFFRYS